MICVLPYVMIFCARYTTEGKCGENQTINFNKRSMTITVVLNMVDNTYRYCLGKTLCAIRVYNESRNKSCLYVLTSRSCVEQNHINDIQVST